MLDGILADTKATEFTVYLSGNAEDNFRYKIYPRYKESRIGKPRPKWLDTLKEHLIVQWGAQIANGMEADDALGIHQDKECYSTVICSIDKDLLQIPGAHYNFVKKEWQYVTESEGLKRFYRQILTGDSGDDIPGLFGIGPTKSFRLLAECQTESDLLNAVYRAYTKRYKHGTLSPMDARAQIQRNGSLLKIKQHEDEGVWECPFHLLKPTEDGMQLSTPPKPEANNPSTEQSLSVETGDGPPLHGTLTAVTQEPQADSVQSQKQ